MSHTTYLRLEVGPLSLVVDEIDGYMRRFMLWTPRGTLRLHNILRGDFDRHLHDHPWDFTSLILTAGYLEHLPGRAEPLAHRAGDVVRHRAEDLHRLDVPSPMWTAVATGPVRRRWGFDTEFGWMRDGAYEAWLAGGMRVDTGAPVFSDGTIVPTGEEPRPPDGPREWLVRLRVGPLRRLLGL